MTLIFVSNVVPDRQEYWTQAFTRSGNNVLLGLLNSFPTALNVITLSTQPIESFPNGPLWVKGKEDRTEGGKRITLGSFLNLKIIKDLYKSLWYSSQLKKWRRANPHEPCKLLVYNIYSPPIASLYKVCKKLNIEIYAILYDLGIPPKRLKLSWLTMLGYKASEHFAKRYIPLLDGRIVINERISEYYAPNKHFLLVDGAINNAVESKLFPLGKTTGDCYTFVCAGMLWDQNGTRLILDALRVNKQENIRVIFAGKGNDVGLIKDAGNKDSRIQYVGMLTMDELFSVYKNADVLLNLRIEEDTDFHFPSKLFEYMAMGKLVLSTPIAHAERDYSQYISFLHDITPEGLAKAIKDITSIPKETLLKRGERTRQFTLENRTWRKRTEEILSYMKI